VSKVIKISDVSRQGLFAPFTPSGKIVVSGAVASNYGTLQGNSGVLQIGNWNTPFSNHWLTDMFLSYHRIVCMVNFDKCRNEMYTSRGLSSFIAKPCQCYEWLLEQGAVAMAIVFVPVLIVILAEASVEALMRNAYLVLFSIILSWYRMKSRSNQHAKKKMM